MIDFGEHVAERKSLDLTPMLDVVFLLLIFFLLTSIFARPLLPLDLPEAASGQVLQEPEISLSIQRDGTLDLNGDRVIREELAEKLAVLLSARTRERDVSLRSDRGVPFGQVVEIMDLAKQAGAENISVVTDQKP
ncbi:biopolymer transporter ExbD [Desulfuromonas sp. CSMB_57]|jgi:biopolymer transport protein ExbD|uniref:ExbD/TolR family protein n=1 Tax=Desulfuromonas sp. CSMB_57 TaxID=2807629 RepID=UPI001CD743D2|nr:biopolymer transporter ExbD [Desulfuromonas sp. CSMB_57]